MSNLKISLVLLSTVIIFLTFACGKKSITVSLSPSKVITKTKQKGEHNETTCVISTCLSTMGHGCEFNPTDGRVRVGYSNSYDPGTDPCNCWEYLNCAWRAYVKFDFSTLPSTDVIAAKLSWTSTTNRGSGDSLVNDPTCAKNLFVATEPWGKYAISGDPLAGEDFSKSISIGDTVRGWVSGSIQNNGLFFVGPKEKFGSENNDQCETTMDNFKLDVIVTVPK